MGTRCSTLRMRPGSDGGGEGQRRERERIDEQQREWTVGARQTRPSVPHAARLRLRVRVLTFVEEAVDELLVLAHGRHVLGRDAAGDVEAAEGKGLEAKIAGLRAVAAHEQIHRLHAKGTLRTRQRRRQRADTQKEMVSDGSRRQSAGQHSPVLSQ